MISLSKHNRVCLAYSLDCLYSGFYFWLGHFTFRLGGVNEVSSSYNFIVPTYIGFGIVISYKLYWHTPFKLFKRID